MLFVFVVVSYFVAALCCICLRANRSNGILSFDFFSAIVFNSAILRGADDGRGILPLTFVFEVVLHLVVVLSGTCLGADHNEGIFFLLLHILLLF